MTSATSDSRASRSRGGPVVQLVVAYVSDVLIVTAAVRLGGDLGETAGVVQAGATGKALGRYFEVAIDPRAAIRRAIELAEPGDTVLLAGKGHERSMRTAHGSEPWDERAEAEAAIRERT